MRGLCELPFDDYLRMAGSVGWDTKIRLTARAVLRKALWNLFATWKLRTLEGNKPEIALTRTALW